MSELIPHHLVLTNILQNAAYAVAPSVNDDQLSFAASSDLEEDDEATLSPRAEDSGEQSGNSDSDSEPEDYRGG